MSTTRRDVLKTIGAGAAALAVGRRVVAAGEPGTALSVNPEPAFDLSPHLYMQFMEPLGTTDGSVEAAWDFNRDCWREDVVDVTRRLAPPLLRWGGCFSSYYRWKEAVGPRNQRVPMQNLLWGGMESNQVGTVEFVDFCRQVGADPLMSVNFESDGRKGWMKTSKGSIRTAGPEEAADWVDYCNSPANAMRLAHGLKEPCPIRLWQLGNETSYDRNGFDCETAAQKTIAFAKAMRRVDPKIALIGWGDSGWAKRMIEIAGEHLQYIAFHHMYHPGAPLQGTEYRKDPARTWQALMDAYKPHEAKIRQMREQTSGTGLPLALTECHFALPGPNRCTLLATWAAGVSMARLLNVHSRNGDVLKIATAADFCGTRWTVNAVMVPVPGGKAFMMPVARVMSLYRAHVGQQAIRVTHTPADLDVTASRSGDRIFLHVVNTHRTRSVETRLAVAGLSIRSGNVFEIACDPELEVWSDVAEAIAPRQKALPVTNLWSFLPASVSAVELDVVAAKE
ncbi:MAG: twin-arginine translocation signal domain-containing protein [Bacillota bacterium]